MKENYLENIRSYIISEQAKTIVRDYSANKSRLETNYNIGKELAEAGKHYGEGIVKKYAKELTKEFGTNYGITNLKYMRLFYNFVKKSHPLDDQLTWSHYKLLLPLKNVEEIKYYISITKRDNLSKRALAERIKSNEYGRLSDGAKESLLNKEELSLVQSIPSPIVLMPNKSYEVYTEKVLQEIIYENLDSFMKQLGG